MTDKQELVDSIHEVFTSHGYTWNNADSGEPFAPTKDHLETALDDLLRTVVESLKTASKDEFVQVEAGRLLVTSRDGVMDVYVHHGCLPLED